MMGTFMMHGLTGHLHQGGRQIKVGDAVQLRPMLGEEVGRIVRLQSMWNERLASGSDCMLANATRFEKPEVCGY